VTIGASDPEHGRSSNLRLHSESGQKSSRCRYDVNRQLTSPSHLVSKPNKLPCPLNGSLTLCRDAIRLPIQIAALQVGPMDDLRSVARDRIIRPRHLTFGHVSFEL
jgi:hypothetical protein